MNLPNELFAKTIAPHLEVDVISASLFTAMNVTAFREAAYGQYREDKRPAPVVSGDVPDETEVYYILATSPDLSSYLVKEVPAQQQNYVRGNVEQLFRHKFGALAGFYRVEIGQAILSRERLIQIEAHTLLDWDGWQDGQYYAYISQLSHNQLLDTANKQTVLRHLHNRASGLLTERFGNGAQFIAIMAPHVRRFVEKSGIRTKKLGGCLRWRDREGQLTPVARQIFLAYPDYWRREDTPERWRPCLWQVEPLFLDEQESCSQFRYVSLPVRSGSDKLNDGGA